MVLAVAAWVLPAAGSSFGLQVANGRGGGSYEPGLTIHVWATPPSPGFVFHRWSGDSTALANPLAWHTTLTMPARDLAIRAEYRPAPAWTFSRDSVQGAEFYYHIPQPHTALVLRFHGSGGSGESITRGGNLAFAQTMVAAGYGIVSPDSADRQSRQWDARTSPASNPDILNLQSILRSLTDRGILRPGTPILLTGTSDGGGFAAVASIALEAKAQAIYIASGARGIEALQSTVPTLHAIAQNDGASGGDLPASGPDGIEAAWRAHRALLSRRIPAELYTLAPSPVYPERFAHVSGITPDGSRQIHAALRQAGEIDQHHLLLRNPRLHSTSTLLPPAFRPFQADIQTQLEQCFAEHTFFNELDGTVLSFFQQALGEPFLPRPAQAPSPVVSAASYAPTIAPDSIFSAFGTGFAQSPAIATSLPLPLSINGTELIVAGRPAPLFAVFPQQVNALLPAETPMGSTTLRITSQGQVRLEAEAAVAPVAPALFSANGSGIGVAAAVALRVRASGERSAEPVARFDAATGRWRTAPLPLGPEGESVFLEIYGTGMRHAPPGSVVVQIGGIPVPPDFAGAHPSLTGLDQINIRLPRELAGRGVIHLMVIAAGNASNSVALEIQ